MSFFSEADVRRHVASSHDVPLSAQRPGRDWVCGETALETLGSRPQDAEQRVERFALFLASCVGVEDLMEPPPRRPELGR